MESPTAPLDLTLKGQTRGHSYFEGLSCKRAVLGHMLLLTIDRKPYMGSPMAP